ncbi:hypothetical protein BHE74_00032496 [Ensete ventricosum]|nr:hypothetical protein BHE74_00032496 [Ensete ventricosum]RZR99244.1 hypothetical protein BHM03_00028747 [Ensete ventricosum]
MNEKLAKIAVAAGFTVDECVAERCRRVEPEGLRRISKQLPCTIGCGGVVKSDQATERSQICVNGGCRKSPLLTDPGDDWKSEKGVLDREDR